MCFKRLNGGYFPAICRLCLCFNPIGCHVNHGAVLTIWGLFDNLNICTFLNKKKTFIANLEELQLKQKESKDTYESEIASIKHLCEMKEAELEQMTSEFAEKRRLIAQRAINSRTGKPLQREVSDRKKYIVEIRERLEY